MTSTLCNRDGNAKRGRLIGAASESRLKIARNTNAGPELAPQLRAPAPSYDTPQRVTMGNP